MASIDDGMASIGDAFLPADEQRRRARPRLGAQPSRLRADMNERLARSRATAMPWPAISTGRWAGMASTAAATPTADRRWRKRGCAFAPWRMV